MEFQKIKQTPPNDHITDDDRVKVMDIAATEEEQENKKKFSENLQKFRLQFEQSRINFAMQFKTIPIWTRLLVLFYFVLQLYIGGVLIQWFYNLKQIFSGNGLSFEPHYDLSAFTAWLFLDFNSTIFGFAVIFTVTAILLAYIYHNKKNDPETRPVIRNRRIVKVVTNDTSITSGQPAWDEDIMEFFTVTKKPQKYTSTIIGKMKNGRYVLLPPPKYDTDTQNTLAIGSAGSKKSRGWIIPLIMQIAMLGHHLIVTDPSSELFRRLKKFLEWLGYKVITINTRHPNHSNSWNFVKDTCRTFKGAFNCARILLNNAVSGDPKKEGKDNFWLPSEINLLTSLMLLTCERDGENASMAKVMGYLDMPDAKLESLYSQLPQNNAAQRSAFTAFRQWYSMDKVPKSQIKSTLGIHLGIFKEEDILAIMSKDDISIYDFYSSKESKTALFLITSEFEDTFSAISGMFFDSTFNLLTEQTIKQGDDCLPNPIQFVLDEFANIGRINDIGKKLSTARKYGFVIHMVLQSLPQFLNRYDRYEAKEIMGNIALQLLLAVGVEDETAEYYSKLYGTMPIATMQTTKNKALQLFTSSARSTISERPIWKSDEIINLSPDTLLVMSKGECPVAELKKADYTDLPWFKYFVKHCGGDIRNTEFPVNEYKGVVLTEREKNEIKSALASYKENNKSESQNYEPDDEKVSAETEDNNNPQGGSLPLMSSSPKPQQHQGKIDIFEGRNYQAVVATASSSRNNDEYKIAESSAYRDEETGLYRRDGTPRFFDEHPKHLHSQDPQLSINLNRSLDEINALPKIPKIIKWENIVAENDTLIAKDRYIYRFICKQFRNIAGKPVIILSFMSNDETINDVLPKYQLRAEGEEIDVSSLTATINEKLHRLTKTTEEEYHIDYWNIIVNKDQEKLEPQKLSLGSTLILGNKHITLVPHIIKRQKVLL